MLRGGQREEVPEYKYLHRSIWRYCGGRVSVERTSLPVYSGCQKQQSVVLSDEKNCAYTRTAQSANLLISPEEVPFQEVAIL